MKKIRAELKDVTMEPRWRDMVVFLKHNQTAGGGGGVTEVMAGKLQRDSTEITWGQRGLDSLSAPTGVWLLEQLGEY